MDDKENKPLQPAAMPQPTLPEEPEVQPAPSVASVEPSAAVPQANPDATAPDTAPQEPVVPVSPVSSPVVSEVKKRGLMAAMIVGAMVVVLALIGVIVYMFL